MKLHPEGELAEGGTGDALELPLAAALLASSLKTGQSYVPSELEETWDDAVKAEVGEMLEKHREDLKREETPGEL